jgi:hypothetical protein
MTDPTDEELAEMSARCRNDANATWWRYKQDVPRLIAALHAERDENERLRSKLLDVVAAHAEAWRAQAQK